MILEGRFLATIVIMSDKLRRVTTPNPAPTSAHELANDLATAFRGYPAGVAILTTMGGGWARGLDGLLPGVGVSRPGCRIGVVG
ncbi:hypothetical protein CUAC110533_04600 [Cutibacterium acnes subsp. elongatum]|jgi:hypothetical protein